MNIFIASIPCRDDDEYKITYKKIENNLEKLGYKSTEFIYYPNPIYDNSGKIHILKRHDFLRAIICDAVYFPIGWQNCDISVKIRSVCDMCGIQIIYEE